MDTPTQSPGSHDGTGAGNHDSPFVFGEHLTWRLHPLFSDRQFARLLCLRSHVLDGDRTFKAPPIIAPDEAA